MATDITSELNEGLPLDGPRLEFTRKAFGLVPKLSRPLILDVGCGKGSVTLELARLGEGRIIGLDISSEDLEKLRERAKEEGLSERIETVNRSMFEMKFPDASFDLIWAEGSIWIIGFEKGLEKWRGLLKPGGFMVVHEMAWLKSDPPRDIRDYWIRRNPDIKTVDQYSEIISKQGYQPISHFALPPELWWKEYYGPLENRVRTLREKYHQKPWALNALDSEQLEISLFKRHRQYYGSAFFIMKKARD